MAEFDGVVYLTQQGALIEQLRSSSIVSSCCCAGVLCGLIGSFVGGSSYEMER